MELTAANKREIELLCARRNEMRRRGQFVGDSAASEDMLDKLLKEDVRLRKVARDSAAPPAPAKPAAATSSPNGQRAVYYVSELIKIMLAIFSDPVLRPMIEQQLKAAGAGAAPAARALPGVEAETTAEIPSEANPTGASMAERYLPGATGDSAPHTLADLLPKSKRGRDTPASLLQNIFTKGRRS